MRHAGAVALVLLSACALHNEAFVPTTRQSGARLSLPEGRLRNDASYQALVYISDPLDNAVKVYRASGQDQKPVATLKDGIKGPAGLAVDNEGNVYVANTAKNTVTEYRRNGASPIATYSRDVVGPVAVAIGDDGTVYVANFDSFAQSVVEFARGSGVPSVIIQDPCGCYPIGLTLDAQQNLYVAYDTFYSQTVIYKYVAGSSNGVSLNVQLGSTRWEAAGLLFDAAKTLLVANASLPGIEVFAPGRSRPEKIFGKVGSPRFLQFDQNENHVFVTDTIRNAVEVYSYPEDKLTDVIGAGLRSAYGVAVSPRAPL